MFGSVFARFGRPRLQAASLAAAAQAASVLTRADEARASVPLTRLSRQATGIVAGVRLGAGVATPAGACDPALERMALRLIEIGFVEGAQLRVIAFGQPGNDPIGVRVGGRGGVSTFALRRQEADCVWVWPDRPAP